MTEAKSGLRFGRYEALARLGKGGMASVFAARLDGEEGFEKLVAVKRMLPHLAEDAELVERFLDEARIAAHIHSAHVVQTLDLGRSDDGAPYIVLDLILGVTLAQLLRVDGNEPESRTSLRVILEILAQAADGLEDAHRAKSATGAPLGVIHRDVSPQNVLIGADGRARLADFGIAHAATSRALTRTGQVMGKFAYLSPEQAAARELDARTDVFSLGVVAWEAVSGRRLFATDTDAQTLANVMNATVLPLREIRADVPPSLSELVASALERDRDARCSSAADFGRGLRAAAATLGPPASGGEIADRVRAAGGATLLQLRAAIASAAGGPSADPATVTSIGAESAVAVSETVVDLATDDLLPVEAAPRRTLDPGMRGSWMGALVVVALLGAALAFVFWRGDGAPEPAAPRVATPPLALDVSEPTPITASTEEPPTTEPPSAEPPTTVPPITVPPTEETTGPETRRRRPPRPRVQSAPPAEETPAVRPGVLVDLERYDDER